jgi:hypothetical protein
MGTGPRLARALMRVGCLALLLVGVTGCSGFGTDINHMALGSTVAVDADGEGKVRLIVEGLQAGAAESQEGGSAGIAGGSGGGPMKPFTLAGSGSSLADALEKVSRQANGRLYMGSTRLIVLGEPLLRRGATKVVEDLMQLVEIPDYTPVVATEGPAEPVVRGPESMHAGGDTYLYRLAVLTPEASVSATPPTLQRLFTSVHEPNAAVGLPLFRGQPPVTGRFGVLRGDHLVAVASANEETLLLAASQSVGPGWLTVPSGRTGGTYVLRLLSLRLNGRLDAHARRATVTVTGRAYIDGDAPILHLGHEDPQLVAAANRQVALVVLHTASELYSKGVDAFGLAEQLPGARPEEPSPQWDRLLRSGVTFVVQSRLELEPGQASV